MAEVTNNPNHYSGNLNIPESITYDGIDYRVKSIGKRAFSYCSDLTSITIPNGVTTIGESAFERCKKLTSISIPDSLKSIEKMAFSGCDGLTKVSFSGMACIECMCNINYYNETSCPLRYAHHLYINGEEVTEIVIPNTVTTIGAYAFSGCYYITSVTIPNTVTTIGFNSFSGCGRLVNISIPNSVTGIVADAFENCSSLTDVYCYAENVPSAQSAFDAKLIATATLHVPAGSIDAYKEAVPWKNFGNIVALAENKGDLNGDFKIDIADAVSILNLMAEGSDDSAADLNGDGKVDIADFVSVLNLMAGQ